MARAMSGATPAGSPESVRLDTRRKLLRLIPARRTPWGASSALTSPGMDGSEHGPGFAKGAHQAVAGAGRADGGVEGGVGAGLGRREGAQGVEAGPDGQVQGRFGFEAVAVGVVERD